MPILPRRVRPVIYPAALVFLLIGLSGCNVNRVPTLDEQVKAAWSEVLNQYQRRSDLIPNLVATVKGYAQHEQQTLTQVVEARAKATQMQLPADILSNPQAFHEFEQKQAALGGALGRGLVLLELMKRLWIGEHIRRDLHLSGFRARLDHLGQGLLLVLGVALHGRDQVRDEVDRKSVV